MCCIINKNNGDIVVKNITYKEAKKWLESKENIYIIAKEDK